MYDNYVNRKEEAPLFRKGGGHEHMSKYRGVFVKGYEQNSTDEMHIINEICKEAKRTCILEKALYGGALCWVLPS